MSQQPVHIAFSAMGDHAEASHLPHLVGSDKCKVVGGFDPQRRLAKNTEWLEKNGLDSSFKQYGSFEDLIADENVDAVLIVAPDRFHLPQLEAAIEAGKHVFCEKPLCDDPKDLPKLKAVLEKAEKKGLKITSCHPRRFDGPYVWLKEHLPELEEKYGKVLSVNLDFTYHEPSPDKADLHNSLLQDHANHEIDYINFLLGYDGIDLTRLADTADRYEISGRRDDGISIHFHGTRRLSARTYPEKIHVRFDRGEVEINTYDNRISRTVDHELIEHPNDKKGSEEKETGIPVEKIDHPVTDYDERFRKINHDWLDSIAQNRPGYLTKEEMLYNTSVSVGFGEKDSDFLRLQKNGSIKASEQEKQRNDKNTGYAVAAGVGAIVAAGGAAGTVKSWLDRTKDAASRKKAIVFGTVTAVAAVALAATAAIWYNKGSEKGFRRVG